MELNRLNTSSSSSSSPAPITPAASAPAASAVKPLSPAPKPISAKRPLPKFVKPLAIVFSILLLFLLITGGVAVLAASQMKDPAQKTIASARAAFDSIQSQNLVEAETHLTEANSSLNNLESVYRRYSFAKLIPFAGAYYKDGEAGIAAGKHTLEAGQQLIGAIEPYADILGLKVKEGAASVDVQSAEDRIVFLVQTLDAISPQLEGVSAKLKLADEELSKINPNRYPKEINGTPVRGRIIQVQETLDSGARALSEAKPLISLLPVLLGQDGEKTYMLLFQNDAELRPTGGFLTAYAYIKVNKGKITPQDSFDIYQLDNRFTKRIPAPDAIKKYLDEDVWHLRNMNISPDYRVSMDTFSQYMRDIPGTPKVDGIIAIDTQVPVMLLQILGPIGVGGWGNFSAEIDPRCNCPQVIYALESIVDKPTYEIREARKAVLGPLMHSILANAMGAPKSTWPKLVNSGLDMIKQKHAMLYFFDPESQALAEAFGAAGRIEEFTGDYLHINGANFGGAKSNMFVEESVEQEYDMSASGEITKTVTVTYNNPHPGSDCNLERGNLCLNGRLRQYVRFYVPKGSELIEMIGSEVAPATAEDLGKTVFEGFFTLRPESQSKLVVRYKLPGTYTSPLPVLIQKQPGTKTVTHQILFNGQPQTVEVVADTRLNLQ